MLVKGGPEVNWAGPSILWQIYLHVTSKQISITRFSCDTLAGVTLVCQLVILASATILVPYHPSQVTTTQLKIGYPQIKFTGTPSSKELQWHDLSSVYTRRDGRWKWVTKKSTGSFTLGAIWRDVAGRHNDAPPEMSPAPILSRRSATSPQIL